MSGPQSTKWPGPVGLKRWSWRLPGAVAAITLVTACGGSGLMNSSVADETTATIPGSSVPGVWSSRTVLPGLELHEGLITEGEGRWSVAVRAAGETVSQVVMSEAEALNLVEGLRSEGISATASEVLWPEGYVSSGDSLGWRAVLDEWFPDESAAQEQARILSDAGWDAVAEWSGAEPDSSDLMLHAVLAVIDPDVMSGRIVADYGSSIDGRVTVAESAAATDAVLAVNAGFFIMVDAHGIPGAPAGIGLYEGELASEATNGRVALVLKGNGMAPRFTELSTHITVTAGEARREVDGINRVPGLIRNCGGVGGDVPTELPLHDFTCTDDHELVLFSDALQVTTPEVAGLEAVLDSDLTVMDLRTPGTAVPSGGYTLQGIGEGADWLAEHAEVGTRLIVDAVVSETETGEILGWGGRKVSAVNAGPLLLHDGRVEIDAAADGLVHPQDRSFAYRWALRRSPRMLMGVDDRERVMFLALSGRTPGVSDGLGLHEAAGLMLAFGARDAVALDGGGSVSMVVEGETLMVGVPSEGERAVGDVLLVHAER